MTSGTRREMTRWLGCKCHTRATLRSLARLAIAARLGVALVMLSALAAPARALPLEGSDCFVHPRDRILLELPAGQDEIETTLSMQWDLEFGRAGISALPASCRAVFIGLLDSAGGWILEPADEGPVAVGPAFTDLFPIDLRTDGRGLFEVMVILTEKRIRIADLGGGPLDVSAAHGHLVNSATLPTVLFDGRHPDQADYPHWAYRETFTGSGRTVSMTSTWSRTAEYSATRSCVVEREMEMRVILRRVTDRCYMRATVVGGHGAGTYSGDVAVLGNPTGVSDSTLDMWFGSPEENTDDRMFQALNDVMNSEAGQEAMEGMTEEQMEQLQELYRNMGTPQLEDPIREVREMLVLTLEDVRFKAAPPDSSLEALVGMAGHFVLSAQIAGGIPEGHDLAVESWTPPVENVGVKGPGLGLASTDTSCGRPSDDPLLVIGRCDYNDEENSLALNDMGALCGDIHATVYNEQCEELTVDASFLAGRSIEQCIR